MNLKSLQQLFIKKIVYQPSKDFLIELIPCGNLSPEQQIAIYQNNMRGALQKTLSQVYPVCQKVLGGNYFKQLARQYVEEYPSKQANLNEYGECFPAFLKVQSAKKTELTAYLYLSDLACLEWFRQSVYYAENKRMFNFSDFSDLTEKEQVQVVFGLSPCLKIVESDYPVLSIWKINQEGGCKQQSISHRPEFCCIYRKNNQIEMNLIDSDIYKLLDLINNQAMLAEIVHAGYASLLPELIQKGWVDSFKIKHV